MLSKDVDRGWIRLNYGKSNSTSRLSTYPCIQEYFLLLWIARAFARESHARRSFLDCHAVSRSPPPARPQPAHARAMIYIFCVVLFIALFRL